VGFLVYPSKKGYRVVQEFWEPKRHSKTVPRESYSAFGFHPNMTLEEARLRASQINQQDQLEKARIAEAASALSVWPRCKANSSSIQ